MLCSPSHFSGAAARWNETGGGAVYDWWLVTSTWAAALGRARATELAAKRSDRSDDMFTSIQWSLTKKWRPQTDLGRTRREV